MTQTSATDTSEQPGSDICVRSAGSKALSKPKLVAWIVLGVFWVIGCWAFIVQSISYSAFDALMSYVTLLGDMMMIFVGLWTLRRRSDILLMVSFILMSAFSTLYLNGNSIVVWLNGLRYYIGYLFALPAMRYLLATPERVKYFIPRFDRSVYLFLIVQAPCIMIQFAVYGAGDHGGGSFGNLYSGLVSMMIYTMSFYLMQRRWVATKNYLLNIKDNWVLVALLFPTFFNETKISFVYMALYFFLLIPFDRRFIKRILIIAPVAFLLLVGAGWMYLQSRNDKDDIFSMEYIEMYLMGDENMVNYLEVLIDDPSLMEGDAEDTARGAKMAILPLIVNDKPHSLLWGYGLGQFKGGTKLALTEFAKHYAFLLVGTQMMVMIWVLETGLLGMIWQILWLCVLFRAFVPKRKKSINKQLMIFLLAEWLLVMLYDSSMVINTYSILFVGLALISTQWRTLPPLQQKRHENTDSQ